MALGDDSSLGSIGSGVGGLLGIAGGIFNATTGSEDAQAIANIEKQMAGTEIQMNHVRQNAMNLTARRSMTQDIRQAQFARAMALNTAQGNQGGGALASSAIGGAVGSISGATGGNILNTSQQQQFGNQMFGLTDQLDMEKMSLADAQAKLQGDQAFGGMLGGIGKSLGPLGSFAGALPGLLAL